MREKRKRRKQGYGSQTRAGVVAIRCRQTRTGVAVMRGSQKRARHARTRLGDTGRCTRLTLFSEGVILRAISKIRRDGLAHIINARK